MPTLDLLVKKSAIKISLIVFSNAIVIQLASVIVQETRRNAFTVSSDKSLYTTYSYYNFQAVHVKRIVPEVARGAIIQYVPFRRTLF